MAKQPRLSIIVPMYNAAATVRQTLESVLALGETAWHCIVVDDGSTDDGAGAAIVREMMAGAGGRLELVSKPNGGLSSARNAGLDKLAATAAIRGEYVLFLDSDDRLVPGEVEKMMGRASGIPGSLVGHFNLCDERLIRQRRQNVAVSAMGLAELLDVPFLVPPCLVHRWQDVAGHRFTPTRRKVEDYDMWLRMALAGVRWTLVDATIADYRCSPQSLSHDYAGILHDGQAVLAEGFARTRAAGSPHGSDASAGHEAAVLGRQALNWATRQAVCAGDDDQAAAAARAGALLAAAPGNPPRGEDFLAGCIDSAVLMGLGVAPERAGERLAGIWQAVLAWCAELERCGRFSPGLSRRLPALLDLACQDRAARAQAMLDELAFRAAAPDGGGKPLVVFGYGTNGRELVRAARPRWRGQVMIRDTRLDTGLGTAVGVVPAGCLLQAWDAPLPAGTLAALTIADEGPFLQRPPLSAMDGSALVRWSGAGAGQGDSDGPWAKAARRLAAG
jgi:hypothetical protein